jgi:MarR family transcriptional regulator, 2-MHQ and catechol-resistance regulon repressor
MHQFLVSDDGRVRETSVHETIGRLQDLFPELDAAAWEAQIMMERTHRLLANLRDSHWTSYGLTGRRFILLRFLFTSAHKRLSMSEIAAHMNLAPNNVTQLIDGLERDGYVRRQAGGKDRRIVQAVLTQQGEELFARVFPETAKRVASTWKDLTDNDKKLLSHLLARLRMYLLTSDAHLREVDFAGAGAEKSKKTRRQLK